jgi:murein DD-endopeptidase MepM/ murein hydrolase activator NlpD
MKLKWATKRYTFVVIPDANSSIRRFEVPKAIPYIAVAALAALVTATIVLFVLHSRTVIVAAELQSRIKSQDNMYSAAVVEKNSQIEQLQSEIIQLAQQTTEMQSKLEDISKLEDEVRSITGSDKVASAGGGESATAMGGIVRPATGSEVQSLVDQTRSLLTEMGTRVVDLQSSISTTKDEALAVQYKKRITPDIWPISSRTITSGFGVRQDPFTFKPSFHSGYDISAPRNTNVYVTADGTVQSTGFDSQHGNNIIVDHTSGLKTWYMHLNKIEVVKGDVVEKGQLIGLVGSTGRSTGNHLHYEVLKNGVSVDPKPYLK